MYILEKQHQRNQLCVNLSTLSLIFILLFSIFNMCMCVCGRVCVCVCLCLCVGGWVCVCIIFVIRIWCNTCYLSKVYARNIGLVYSNVHVPQNQIGNYCMQQL